MSDEPLDCADEEDDRQQAEPMTYFEWTERLCRAHRRLDEVLKERGFKTFEERHGPLPEKPF